MSAILELRGLCRHYGGVRAVDSVDLCVDAGTLLGLIGPNGAGKTTLLNLVSGLDTATAGRVILDGRDVTGWAPHRRAAAGLARTFQSTRLLRGLSALENVVSAMHVHRPNDLLRAPLWPWWNRRALIDEAEALLGRVGLRESARRCAGELAYGDQRRLEIARALAIRPTLLLLDEPVAGLNATETARLRELLLSLHGEGLSIVLVEHHLDVVMNVCDLVVVVDFGRVIAAAPPGDVVRDPRVVEAYLGRAGARRAASAP